MIIDTQCHVFPREYGEFLVKHAVSFKARQERGDFFFDFNGSQKLAMTEEQYNLSAVIASMDRAKVDVSIITCNIPDPGLLPSEHVVDGCRLANELIKDIADKSNGRFAGLAILPWQHSDAAIAELNWAVENGFKGVMLFSNNGGVHTDDKSLEAVYEMCAKLHMPVVIHPSLPVWYKEAGSYGLVASAGFVMDTSLALLRMIFSGVFDRIKNLKVVMPHAGGVLPYLDGRLNPNRKLAQPDVQNQGKGKVIDRLKSGNIWYDCANASADVLRFALDYFSDDKLLFGSDYPFIEPDLIADLLNKNVPSNEAREKIFYKNTVKLFRFEI